MAKNYSEAGRSGTQLLQCTIKIDRYDCLNIMNRFMLDKGSIWNIIDVSSR